MRNLVFLLLLIVLATVAYSAQDDECLVIPTVPLHKYA